MDSNTDTVDLACVCDECDKKFKHASSLKKHKLIHTGVLNYVCTNCTERFSRSEELRIHQSVHTGEQPFAAFVCTVCKEQFKYANNLRTQSLIHTDVYEFPCDECDRKFYDASHLRRHKQTHTGVRPHACAQCNQKSLAGWNIYFGINGLYMMVNVHALAVSVIRDCHHCLVFTSTTNCTTVIVLMCALIVKKHLHMEHTKRDT